MTQSSVYLLAGFFSATALACGSGGGSASGGTAGSMGPAGGGSSSTPGGAANNGGSNNSAAGDASGGASGGVQGGAAGAQAGTGTGGDSQPPGIYPVGSCSEATLRTAPPAGKEMFKAAPVDTKFPFSEHWIGEWTIAGTEPSRIGMQTMADLDDDGDLDFAAGQRQTLPGGMVWWEQCTADHWVAHKVGTGHKSQSAGDALDVDGDGLNDLLAGDSWYKNPGMSRDMEWQRINAKTPDAEELTVGDVTGDGTAEVMYVHNSFNPQFWSPGATPLQGFSKGLELAHPVQQGVAWGDLNGDKANDWLISKDWWYENNGTGTMFTAHQITATSSFDPAPLTYIGDVDGDGDNDFAMVTHWMAGDGARLAWVENSNSDGLTWELHQLSDAHEFSHGVILADFDNDKDLDLMWGQNIGPSFIYENTDGKGAFVEHKIVNDFRGHTPRIGDADCDGDLDIAGSPWGDRGQGSSGESVGMPARDALYLQNMTVENGGTPIFDADRLPYELGWREKPHCRK